MERKTGRERGKVTETRVIVRGRVRTRVSGRGERRETNRRTDDRSKGGVSKDDDQEGDEFAGKHERVDISH